MMVGLMEHQKDVQEQLLEEDIWENENNCLAREVHECTISALLTIVHEGLLQQSCSSILLLFSMIVKMPCKITKKSKEYYCDADVIGLNDTHNHNINMILQVSPLMDQHASSN